MVLPAFVYPTKQSAVDCVSTLLLDLSLDLFDENSRLTVLEDLSSIVAIFRHNLIVAIQHQCEYSSRKVRSSFVRPFDVADISEWIRSSLRETWLADGRNSLRACFDRMQMTHRIESWDDLMYGSLRSVVVEAWNKDA